MIVRDAGAGLTRFDQFLNSLSIAPNVLTTRLKGLIGAGVLETRQYNDRPPRNEYLLTTAGRDLLPVIDALSQWGAQHFPQR